MLLGVMSDSHDRLPMIDRAISLFNRLSVHALIHAGDIVAPFAAKRLFAFRGPVYAIYGNNDGERKMLRDTIPQIKDGPLLLDMAGRRVLVHHYIDWCSSQHLAQADIVITGHTHEVVNEQQDGTLFVNPGESCGWLFDRCTVAIIDTDMLTAEVIDLEGG